MKEYNPQQIEPRWQQFWEENRVFQGETDSKSPKKYCLDMFAYPSGDGLHVGHPRSYTATDIFARYYRMKGFNVMRPIGWDAFGLPAENYAIKVGKHPQETTEANIATFTKQIKSFGFAYDWSRELKTSDPNYYKWTQWIFKVLYDNDYAYQKEAYANWCPSCQTVLANEQVVDGKCERCGTPVEQKKLKQWFFKITDFAEELLKGLDELDWPESTKTLQRNWIGRSEGAELEFKIVRHPEFISGSIDAESSLPAGRQVQHDGGTIKVFTTRADTLFGATYMVLAPEHELVVELTTPEQRAEVEKYVAETKLKTNLDRTVAKEKTGVFTGSYAINPATGKEIPIWIADYVLTGYGTGAIMAVPAHDERDFEFAKKFDLPIIEVISGGELPYVGEGKLINSGEFDGQEAKTADKAIAEKFGGKLTIQYKLHDWLISRQRYWGAPIPIVYSADGIAQSVSDADLPVILPDDVDFRPTGESPLAQSHRFQEGVEAKYGPGAKRELDTMDTFVCSSWYFLRYCDPRNDKEFADKKSLQYWMPVNLYIGGAEHATGHLLYSRFITKVLQKLGYLKFGEPFLKLRHQGLVLGSNGEKMSKSRGNVVNPDELVAKFGADTIRTYEMFMGPFDQMIPWDTNGVMGVRRFLDRVWRLVNDSAKKPMTPDIEISLHKTIKKVTEDIEEMKFNTAISAMMEFINEVSKAGVTGWEEPFVKLLSPFAPHMAEELWQGFGNQTTIISAEWPSFNEKKLVVSQVEIVVQEKGKVRGTITIAVGASEDEVVEAMKQNEKFVSLLANATKRIYVQDKIINLV